MKTIKEAAREYFRAGQLGFKPAADTEAAFIAGVEFAQQWTSVEEKLPEINTPVIVQTGYGIKKVAQIEFVNIGTGETIEGVQFWRLIELIKTQ